MSPDGELARSAVVVALFQVATTEPIPAQLQQFHLYNSVIPA